MRAEFVPLYTSIWVDKKLHRISDDPKKCRDAMFLFIYLLSNESITLTGIYDFDIEVCKLRAKFNNDFQDIFQLIIDTKLIKWDIEKEKIWVVNRFKLIPTSSRKVVGGAIKELNMIDHPFKHEFLKKYEEEFKSYYFMIKGYENKADSEWYYNEKCIKDLAKIYSDKRILKEKLMNRGAKESRLDEILPQVVSYLYK